MASYQVPAGFTGKYAKDFLRREAGVSLTLWRRIKRKNDFYINGTKTSPGSAIIQPGDIISYTLEDQCALTAVKLDLDIRYEDEDLLVVNKPAGQLVHPTGKEHFSTLGNAILYHYKEKNLPYAFHPVHRLDRNTSGLVLIAKQPQVQHQLSTGNGKLFLRRYLGIIAGQMLPAAGSIAVPIGRKPGSIIERMVCPEGQPALTHYKTLQSGSGLSLLSLELATGRTHQIRVHLAHCQHPLLGDDLYGGSTEQIARQALHAFSLAFIQPRTGKEIEVHCPLPEDMTRILSSF